MLRISRLEDKDGSVILKLEGMLVDQWVVLLEELCEIHQREIGTPLVLDLADVEIADEQGIEAAAQPRRTATPGLLSCSDLYCLGLEHLTGNPLLMTLRKQD